MARMAVWLVSHYKCRGCGELDSIVEIDSVPRIVSITPEADEDSGFDYPGWTDEAFWESSTTIGYGCMNDGCDFWQGNYGHTYWNEKLQTFVVDNGNQLELVAELAE